MSNNKKSPLYKDLIFLLKRKDRTMEELSAIIYGVNENSSRVKKDCSKVSVENLIRQCRNLGMDITRRNGVISLVKDRDLDR
jgi:hypothetical protein